MYEKCPDLESSYLSYSEKLKQICLMGLERKAEVELVLSYNLILWENCTF